MSQSEQRRAINVQIHLLTTYDTETPGVGYRVEEVYVDGKKVQKITGPVPYAVWEVFGDEENVFSITVEAGSA